MNNKKYIIASFPMPAPETYYFWLYNKEMEKLGYSVLNTKQMKFNMLWVIKYLRQVSLLHFHWPEYLYSSKSNLGLIFKSVLFIMTLIFARLCGYKIVWTVHNLYPHEKKGKYVGYLTRLLLIHISHILFVHFEGAKNCIKKTFFRTHKIYTIPHGNFISVFKNEYSKKQAREKMGLSPDNFVYLIFGPLRAYKGIEDAVECFEKIKQSQDILMVVGKPFDRGINKWLLSKSCKNPQIIFYPHFIESDAVQYFFNAADVVLLPYKNIFTSGNLFLALGFRKPVIAPAIGILPEIVSTSYGMLYVPDPLNSGLRSALQKIKTEDHVEMGKQGFFHIQSYQWKTAASISHAVYTKEFHF